MLREGAEAGDAIAWSVFDEDPVDYVAAYKRQKELSGAKEFGGAAISLHGLMIISPEWLAEVGDVHDRNNPRIDQMIEMTKTMIEQEIGGLYALRFDLDELGSGVVDFFCAPTAERQRKPSKNGSRKPVAVEISVRKALKALQVREGERTEGAALQSMAARWCQKHLDPRIERGTRKALTGAQHLQNEVYRAWADRAHQAITAETEKAAAEIAAGRAALVERAKEEKERVETDRCQVEAQLQALRDQQENDLAAERERLAAAAERLAAERKQLDAALADQTQRLDEMSCDLETRAQGLDDREAAIALEMQRSAAAQAELQLGRQKLEDHEIQLREREKHNEALSKKLAEQQAAISDQRHTLDQDLQQLESREARLEAKDQALSAREAQAGAREATVEEFAAHCVALAAKPRLANSDPELDPEYDARRHRLARTSFAAQTEAVTGSFRALMAKVEGWQRNMRNAVAFLAEICAAVVQGERGVVETLREPKNPLAAIGMQEAGERIVSQLDGATRDIHDREIKMVARETALRDVEKSVSADRGALDVLHAWLRARAGLVVDDGEQPKRTAFLEKSSLASVTTGFGTAYSELLERGKRTAEQQTAEANRLRAEAERDRKQAAEDAKTARETAGVAIEYNKHLLQVFSEMPKSLQDRVSSKFKAGERVRAIFRGVER